MRDEEWSKLTRGQRLTSGLYSAQLYTMLLSKAQELTKDSNDDKDPFETTNCPPGTDGMPHTNHFTNQLARSRKTILPPLQLTQSRRRIGSETKCLKERTFCLKCGKRGK